MANADFRIRELRAHSGAGRGEAFKTWPWSRSPRPIAAAYWHSRPTGPFKAFRSFAKTKCRKVHRRHPPETCNAVGHSAGGLIAAYAASHGSGIDFLMTMASPFVNAPYYGWYNKKYRRTGRPFLWFNLRERGKLGDKEHARDADYERRLDLGHGGFWKSIDAAWTGAVGICEARQHVRHRRGWRRYCR